MDQVPADIRKLIQDRLDNRLAPEASDFLDEMIEEHELLAKEVEEFDTLHSMLSNMRDDYPTSLHAQIMAKVQALHQRERLYQKLSLILCLAIGFLLFQYFNLAPMSIENPLTFCLTQLQLLISQFIEMTQFNFEAASFFSLPLATLLILPCALAANVFVIRSESIH